MGARSQRESQVMANRYATALFNVASQTQSINDVTDQLSMLEKSLKDQPHALTTIRKAEILQLSLDPFVSSLTQTNRFHKAIVNLLRLLAERGRMSLLLKIIDTYQTIKAKNMGQVEAKVTTPFALDKSLQDKLAQRIKESLGAHANIDFEQDPDLIAGMRIQVGSRVLDGSFKRMSQRLQSTLGDRL